MAVTKFLVPRNYVLGLTFCVAQPESDMSRYFFHVREGDHLIVDEEGMEFDDNEGARDEALEGLREIIADRIRSHHPANNLQIEVCSEDGKLLYAAKLESGIF
jgi:flagellar biosynthesis GTPase FlhF